MATVVSADDNDEKGIQMNLVPPCILRKPVSFRVSDSSYFFCFECCPQSYVAIFWEYMKSSYDIWACCCY